MLLDQTTIILCYEKIQKKATNGGCTVVIFVTFDADALCALKIFTVKIEYKIYGEFKLLKYLYF